MSKSGRSDKDAAKKVVATNRRARHDYEVIDTYEAGIVLVGSEVKSLRAGQANLKDAYASIERGELWLDNLHIAPYKFASIGGHEPERRRKLLLHRREIDRIASLTAEKGLTLVPLAIYFRDGKAKIELALARGRRLYDKRETARRKAMTREVEAALKGRRR